MPSDAPATRAETDDARRRIPRTDHLLADRALAAALRRHGPALVKAAVAAAQAEARAGLLAPGDVLARAVALADAPEFRPSTQRAALNATGVVVHTNLGRAPLSAAARAAVAQASGYVDVEYDASHGGRGTRGRGARAALLAACPPAGDALIVNNGAAALSLAVTALAAGGELLVSRGELVEIGDGFRLPDLIAATGVRLVEVGTTNRTCLTDYADAADAWGPRGDSSGGISGASAGEITGASATRGALLKVHPSNFRIDGFTAQASVAELAGLAGRLGVPLIVDIGSGLLAADPALPEEPDAATALRAGASLVTCSGDKLLGGPQAGLVLGDAELIQRLRRHPLQRAFRADKLALAALEATLRGPEPPVTTYRRRTPAQLRDLAEELAGALRAGVPGGPDPEVVEASGRVGGGGAPGVRLPGWAVALPEAYAAELRRGHPLVVARLEGGRCLLDPRCLEQAQFGEVVSAVVAAAGRLAGR